MTKKYRHYAACSYFFIYSSVELPSMLINLGFSALEIPDRLGHESVKTTLDTYSHLYPDKDQQLADRLDQFRLEDPKEKETP